MFSSTVSSDDSNPRDYDKPVPPPVLVYHDSARSIVFRDHLRRATSAASDQSHSKENTKIDGVEVTNYQPKVTPLPSLQLTAKDEFSPLLDEIKSTELTEAEKGVVAMLQSQDACVKTVKNIEWTDFLTSILETS